MSFQPPCAKPASGGSGVEGLQAFGEERLPVVGVDFVEGGEDIVGGVGIDGWLRAAEGGAAGAFAVEGAAEVVERFLAFGLLADERVGVEPDEFAFVVEVDAAAAVAPLVAGLVELRGHVGGVLKWSPGAAATDGEAGGDEGEVFAVIFRRPEAGAGGHHAAVVFGQAFVDPEQVVLHGLLVVGRKQVSGATMLAVPGVEVFVSEEAGEVSEDVVVDQCPFVSAVVGALMMFEAVVAGAVAEREEEVVTLVVPGAEESGVLGRDALVVFQTFCGQGEGGFAVGGDVEDVRRGCAGGEIELLKVAAGEDEVGR